MYEYIIQEGGKGGIRSNYSSTYSVTLYEILKAYGSSVMKKDFMRINIPILPVFTTEEGYKKNKDHFSVNYLKWKNYK